MGAASVVPLLFQLVPLSALRQVLWQRSAASLSQGHCRSWQSSKRAHSLPALGSAVPGWLGELGSLGVGGRQRLVYLGHERIKCLPSYAGTLF